MHSCALESDCGDREVIAEHSGLSKKAQAELIMDWYHQNFWNEENWIKR